MVADDAVTIREITFGSPSYDLAVGFRDRHLRQPLGLSLDAADLEGEERQIHIAAVADGCVVGTVVLKPSGPILAKLRQMAVAPDVGRTGLGRRLVGFAEALARGRGFEQVEMSSRMSARGFYEKLGYEAVGPVFTDLTVPHVRMLKRL